MRDASLPDNLLFAALGLALAFAPPKARAAGLLTFFTTLGACTFLSAPQRWVEGVFFIFWIDVIVTAGSVHLFHGLRFGVAVALAGTAAFLASAVTSVVGSPTTLLIALPSVLIVLPATLMVRRGTALPAKVAASWILAIAALAVALQWLPVTPGYLPDHLE